MSPRRFRIERVWMNLSLALLLAGSVSAQTGTASITGLVTDESGGAVPGVTVTATHQATGVAFVAVSNEAGNYTIAPLTVGSYAVTAELIGSAHRASSSWC